MPSHRARLLSQFTATIVATTTGCATSAPSGPQHPEQQYSCVQYHCVEPASATVQTPAEAPYQTCERAISTRVPSTSVENGGQIRFDPTQTAEQRSRSGSTQLCCYHLERYCGGGRVFRSRQSPSSTQPHVRGDWTLLSLVG